MFKKHNILYVNGEYRGDNDLGKLMHDFSCSNPDEMMDKEMAEVSRYYKETKEGQDIMCKVMDAMKIPSSERPQYTSMLQ